MKLKKYLMALGLVVSACGGGGDGGGGPTTDSFCRDKAKFECNAVADKCATDATVCQEKRFTACKTFSNTQAVGVRIFKAGNMGACTGEVKSLMGKPTINGTEWARLTDKCSRVWEGSGTLESTSMCTSPYDCISRFVCDKGFCSTETKKVKDQFCNNPGEVCQTGQSCQVVDSAGRPQNQCRDNGTLGSPCDAAKPCLDNLRCAGGMCSDKLGTNEVCVDHANCVSGLCEPFQKRCLSGIVFSANGDTCTGFLAGTDVTGIAPGGGTPPAGNMDAGAMPMTSVDAAPGN